MTPRAILLAAAEKIDNGTCSMCCYAIEDVSEEHYSKAEMYFEKLFSPYFELGPDLFYGPTRIDGMPFWSHDVNPTNQKLRVLCLLFAAWSYEP